jgi:hypothetical protein
MLKQNCIAHPTVMMRSEIIKQLKYRDYQKNIEDYDLWLRLLNRGYKITNWMNLFCYIEYMMICNIYSFKKGKPFFKHLAMKSKFLIPC